MGYCPYLLRLPIHNVLFKNRYRYRYGYVHTQYMFFLTCQVRVARFYVSCTPSPPRPPPPRPPPLRDLICKRFAVVPAGPQLQARDRSGPR